MSVDSQARRVIQVRALTGEAFIAYGDVIEASGEPSFWINRDQCARYHNLATPEFIEEGVASISVFKGNPYAMPLTLEMMERHPLGSQAFLPMSADPFLITVATDQYGEPTSPQAFITNGNQGVNYHRGIWHGVLTPIGRPASFAVVDRIGEGDNLQEHWFEKTWLVVDGDGIANGASQAP